MANSNESVPWTILRLEELIRIIDAQAAESCERKKKFRQKLESLKERQEELQQRRVSRLSDEGIRIDLALVKRHAKEPQVINLSDAEEENIVHKNALTEKLRELFKPKETEIGENENYDYDSEKEYDVGNVQRENKQRESEKSLVKIPSSELNEFGEESEEDTQVTFKPSTDKVKTVQVRVKKHGTKRSVKTIGQVVSTTKYLSNVSSKNHKSINRQKVEESKGKHILQRNNCGNSRL